MHTGWGSIQNLMYNSIVITVTIQYSHRQISIGNHTHSSPIWEMIILYQQFLKNVRGEAEYNF